jgi:hypothetical protein
MLVAANVSLTWRCSVDTPLRGPVKRPEPTAIAAAKHSSTNARILALLLLELLKLRSTNLNTTSIV